MESIIFPINRRIADDINPYFTIDIKILIMTKESLRNIIKRMKEKIIQIYHQEKKYLLRYYYMFDMKSINVLS